MSGRVKVGVFGAARGMTMIKQLANSQDGVLVAVCDKYKPLLDKCRALAEEKGLKLELFEDFEDFIQCDMDAVVLANYANEHVPFAIRLLESGRHVMSEVLTCATMAEGLRLAEAVERTGKIYCYAENYCYFNTTTEMRKRYMKGDFGELLHAEGEYIHDCSSIWPDITYGERNHWRNQCYSSFYCTHSIGPILFSTGLRPKRVIGIENPNTYMRQYGMNGGGHAMEIIELENGATLKSIHFSLKREPFSVNYEMYCEKGVMETDRWDFQKLHTYIEGEELCKGEHLEFKPEFDVAKELVEAAGHGGSDFFTVYYFIRQILGDEEAKKNCIDVYQALDMCTPGILAFKSICNGNVPFDVPDFRDKTVREQYRNDNFCTFKEIAGDQWVSPDRLNRPEIPDSAYQAMYRQWQENLEKAKKENSDNNANVAF